MAGWLAARPARRFAAQGWQESEVLQFERETLREAGKNQDRVPNVGVMGRFEMEAAIA